MHKYKIKNIKKYLIQILIHPTLLGHGESNIHLNGC